VLAATGTLLAVISGAVGLGSAHRLAAALAAPPIVALVVAAFLQHRPLLPSTAAAGVLLAAAQRRAHSRVGVQRQHERHLLVRLRQARDGLADAL